VSYVRYGHSVGASDAGPGGISGGKHGGPRREDRYAAFVLAAGGAPRFVPIGPARMVDSLARSWRRSAAGTSRSDEVACLRAGRMLRRLVWDPVAPRATAGAMAFVVPDGALNLVNIAALPGRAGHYVVESGPLIHYFFAEREIVEPGPPPTGNERLLAVGGVDFDHPAALPPAVPAGEALAAASDAYRGATSRCKDFGALTFAGLPGTKSEAEAVAGLWAARGGSRTADGRTTEPIVLTRREASEGAVKRLAPSCTMLHLATHGFFLDAGCSSATGASAAAEIEDPLVRAGLVLAGANLRAAHGGADEDGILTAEEIAALDLSRTRWVALSACETGLGEMVQGEGVFGLRRAFSMAGARTLITSLWRVKDEPARAWMQELYTARFIEGRPTAEAVRDAERRVLKARRLRGESTHPAYWGGFVASGDWR
jgi:CHAT domain-containing protein